MPVDDAAPTGRDYGGRIHLCHDRWAAQALVGPQTVAVVEGGAPAPIKGDIDATNARATGQRCRWTEVDVCAGQDGAQSERHRLDRAGLVGVAEATAVRLMEAGKDLGRFRSRCGDKQLV